MQPENILEQIWQQVSENPDIAFIDDQNILDLIRIVSQNTKNRAGVRLVLACSLAVVHNSQLDIRKPYTEIASVDSFSGRTYDERYISEFVMKHNLPCNSTTAFLTPALRNRNDVLELDTNLVGRPPIVYSAVLKLFHAVYINEITAYKLLAETIRQLLLFQNQNQNRMAELLSNLRNAGEITLSSEQILTLIRQHLSSKGASRLPVLVVASAYKTIEHLIHETIQPLEAHNAADSQTNTLGDIQIIQSEDKTLVTAYEMKAKQVSSQDIDIAIQKIAQANQAIDNYIFITTENFDQQTQDYARIFYDETGVEIVILDCLDFLKYFLHLFHRYRLAYLNNYQSLVLSEPNSAVSQPLKEAFLALRQAAESDANDF